MTVGELRRLISTLEDEVPVRVVYDEGCAESAAVTAEVDQSGLAIIG